MDPTPPAGEPAASPQPIVAWAPPPPGGPTGGPTSGAPRGALFDQRDPASLTFTDAIRTGFTILTKPAYVVPVLVLGVIVNAILQAVLQPFVSTTVTPGTALTNAQIQTFVQGISAGVAIGIIGGVIINLYGQIWAAAASSGPLPSFSETLVLVGKRWIGVIGTGIVVAVIEVVLLVAVVLVGAVGVGLLGALGLVPLIVALVVYIWVGVRLSMAGWLAADGDGVSASVNGSWRITYRNLSRIIGWSFVFGIIFAIIGAIIGAILGVVPIIGAGVGRTLSSALGYGGAVALFRRTQAAATPAPTTPEA